MQKNSNLSVAFCASYTYDANGNISEYVSPDVSVAAPYDYSPFGETLVASGPLASTFTHRFSTKPWCPVTGFCEYQMRKYNPNLGRWMSRDPMEEEGGQHLYRFCDNCLYRHDVLGQYVELVYDVANKTLTATDVDSKETITLVEKVFSGNGDSCCVKDDQWKKDRGPLPIGKYLVGQSFVPVAHRGQSGDYNWYHLYGPNGEGGYSYSAIPVKAPNGMTVIRGGFNLHTGRRSDGCATVWSDIGEEDDGYPHSNDFDKLREMLDKTRPLRYKDSNYSGWLEVK